MDTTPPHVIYDDNDNNRPLAYVHPASAESVLIVLSAKVGNEDGRSEPLWLRLPNGDLMLGIFPRGDTYSSIEIDAEWQGSKR